MTDSSQTVALRRFGAAQAIDETDRVAVEAPLEIRLRRGDADAQSISITLRTPGHDAELALGFLISEGIVARPSDVAAVAMSAADQGHPAGDVVEVLLAAGVAVDLDRLQRHFYATSSCGVCGRASLEALEILGRHKIHANDFAITAETLHGLPQSLSEQQTAFAQTGGLHATAIFDARGHIHCVREDVGRHNATDKVIGAALQADGLPLARRGLLFSGRASFEIMQKALLAGCPLVAAVGAPSSLAVELAWEFGISLVGFLRDDRFNVYAGQARIQAES